QHYFPVSHCVWVSTANRERTRFNSVGIGDTREETLWTCCARLLHVVTVCTKSVQERYRVRAGDPGFAHYEGCALSSRRVAENSIPGYRTAARIERRSED